MSRCYSYINKAVDMKRELYLKRNKTETDLIEYTEEGIIAWYVASCVTEDGWAPASVDLMKTHEPLKYTEALLHIDAKLGVYHD